MRGDSSSKVVGITIVFVNGSSAIARAWRHAEIGSLHGVLIASSVPRAPGLRLCRQRCAPP
jgi:hypothetical protein